MTLSIKSIARGIGLLIPLAVGLACAKLLTPFLPQFSAWINTLGAWAPVAFVAIYIVAVVVMFPVFLLTIAAGAVFGVTKGSVLAMIGAVVGAIGSFVIARYGARDFVAKRIARSPRLVALDRAIGEDGRRLVFFLRLSGTVPFVATNYALGVSRVRLGDYILGTFGLIPTVITYALYGRAAGGIDPKTGGASPMSTPVLVASILATVVLVVILTRITQRALAEAGVTTESGTTTSSNSTQLK